MMMKIIIIIIIIIIIFVACELLLRPGVTDFPAVAVVLNE